MIFREVLRQQIKEKGLSVQEIAKIAGCSKAYIYDLLKGARRFNEEIEIKICDYLGLEKVYIEKLARNNQDTC